MKITDRIPRCATWVATSPGGFALVTLLALAAAPLGWAQQSSLTPAITNPVVPSRALRTVFSRPARPADLVAIKETLASAGVPLEPKRPWGWVWAGAVFVACGAGLYLLLRPSKRAAEEQAAAYALPAHITPFSVLSLLRSM